MDKTTTTTATKEEQVINTPAPSAAPPSKAVKLTCPEHGDVTTSALYMTFKNGEKVDQFLYCLPCLNKVLLSLQKEGAIHQVQVEVAQEATTEVPVS